MGAAKVRIHKLSNTYNGHGPEASSRIRIQIQHSALTVNTHTHIEYSHKQSTLTHSHTNTHLHTLVHIYIEIRIKHLDSILGHTLRVTNGQQSQDCPLSLRQCLCPSLTSSPPPIPFSCHSPSALALYVCEAFFARCDQKLKNRLQL